MVNTASDLSKKTFQKMVTGGKSYLPSKISKELKSAGLAFSGSRVSQQKAMKALNYLKEKGMISKYKAPSDIYRQAAIEQYQQDQAIIDAERQEHVRTNIIMDLSEELEEEERGQDSLRYDPRSVLGRRNVVAEIEKERRSREKKVKTEKQNMEKLTNPKGVKPKKIDLPDLPDMPIDFGN